jgi:hypothetical protein
VGLEVVLFLGEEFAARVHDEEPGSEEEKEKNDTADGDDHIEIGVFGALGIRVGSGWIGHMEWDAGRADEAHA